MSACEKFSTKPVDHAAARAHYSKLAKEARFRIGDRVRAEAYGLIFDGIYVGLADDHRSAQVECDGDRLEFAFAALTVTAHPVWMDADDVKALDAVFSAADAPYYYWGSSPKDAGAAFERFGNLLYRAQTAFA
jgi:hypothetical protein